MFLERLLYPIQCLKVFITLLIVNNVQAELQVLNLKSLQVVAGANFEVTYSIVQTNCSKKDFLLLTPECKSLPNGVSRQKFNDRL